MNFWTQLLWRERSVGVAHELVVCVFKTVFKYSFCIVILKTPVRIPNHCGLDFAGIWKVTDSERKPPLNREHVWLAWGPRVWALGVPKPWAKSPQLRRSGNACFYSAGLSPTSSAKCHPLVLQELLLRALLSVKLYQVLLEMRWATCCSRHCVCDLCLWLVRLLMMQIKGFCFFVYFWPWQAGELWEVGRRVWLGRSWSCPPPSLLPYSCCT